MRSHSNLWSSCRKPLGYFGAPNSTLKSELGVVTMASFGLMQPKMLLGTLISVSGNKCSMLTKENMEIDVMIERKLYSGKTHTAQCISQHLHGWHTRAVGPHHPSIHRSSTAAYVGRDNRPKVDPFCSDYVRVALHRCQSAECENHK